MSQFTPVRFGLTLVTMIMALTMGGNVYAVCHTECPCNTKSSTKPCPKKHCQCTSAVTAQNCNCGESEEHFREAK